MTIKHFEIDHINLDTDLLANIPEQRARSVVVAELNHLIQLANSPDTLSISIAATVQEIDNQMQYRNTNAAYVDNLSTVDYFRANWQHSVSSEVKETFQRLTDQLIPEYVPDGRHTELNLGNAQINFTGRNLPPDDCMCDDSTAGDED